MQLDADWLKAQGDDAMLLFSVNGQFFLKKQKVIAVAVSGGGDSMALLHLAHRVAEQAGVPVHAVTVDHGLRPESASEAQAVAAFCESINVPHETLVWKNDGVSGNLSAAARDARYRMIAAWAKRKKIGHILLGHTQDDYAENFLMALSRSAGVDGLSAMDTQFERSGVTFARPLWQTSRAELRDYLTRFGIDWVDDPTNDDDRYLRTRVRKALPVLDALGITQEKLCEVGLNARITRSALDHQMHQDAQEFVTQDRGDLIIQNFYGQKILHFEIERRLTRRMVQWINFEPYPPRQSSLTEATASLSTAGKATIGGCVLTREKNISWRITREFQAVRGTVCATDAVWDNRWQLDGPHAPDLQIRALGDGIHDCPNWRETGMPRVSLLASPAVWRNDTLISAPLAGYNDEWSARIVADFHSYLLAH